MDELRPGPSSERRGFPRWCGVRRFLERFTTSRGQLEAEELREGADKAGATPIRECGDRARVTLLGTLRTVTLQPRGDVPAVEAELYDGSGTIDIVWLGRRRIAGIEPGRMICAHGLVTEQDGKKVMFNPRYELRSRGTQ